VDPYTEVTPGKVYTGTVSLLLWAKFYFKLPAFHYFVFEEVAPNLAFYYQANLPIRTSTSSATYSFTLMQIDTFDSVLKPLDRVCPQPVDRTIYIAAQCNVATGCPYSVRIDIGKLLKLVE
jgi:hypothetical protein